MIVLLNASIELPWLRAEISRKQSHRRICIHPQRIQALGSFEVNPGSGLSTTIVRLAPLCLPESGPFLEVKHLERWLHNLQRPFGTMD